MIIFLRQAAVVGHHVEDLELEEGRLDAARRVDPRREPGAPRRLAHAQGHLGAVLAADHYFRLHVAYLLDRA